MSAFGSYKRAAPSAPPRAPSPPSVPSHAAETAWLFDDEADQKPARVAGAKRQKTAGGGKGGGKAKMVASDSDDESYLPNDDFRADMAIAPLLAAGMGLDNKPPLHKPPLNKPPLNLDSDQHDYIRERCLVPSENLSSFPQVLGARDARIFAQQYRPVSVGAVRAVSGLLLFGPSGTGKSLVAQAICVYIGGTFYRFSAADLPPGRGAAQMIDALFDVAMAGSLPAVIFIDECDGILSTSAPQRVGHFAGRFERFKDNLLVIGATNEPDKIAPKILTGRFERKIFMDNPDSAARKALILRQLAEEDEAHMLDPKVISDIVMMTAGRSAVNMERLVSSAAMHAGGAPVSLADFEAALGEEPSDFDKVTASKNAKFDRAHGWHPQ